MNFVVTPVPFIQVGNRQALTCSQLVEDPSLADFVKRFPDSFEKDIYLDVIFFKESQGAGR